MVRGSCLCGAFRFEIDGRVSDIHRCHCSVCRKATGAGAIAVLATAAKSFEWVCGEDAIRIVLGVVLKGDRFKPLAKSRKVLRTAPQGAPADRLEAFLGRLRQILRETYAAGRKVPTCPDCAGPMVERSGRNGTFYGCLGYPECRGTRQVLAPVRAAS